MEHQKKPETITDQYAILTEAEPKLVTNFVPADAVEQKRLFLEGATRNPDHEYAKLDAIDFEEQAEVIVRVGGQIAENPALNPKFRAVYAEFVDGYLAKHRLMQLAYAFKHEEDPAGKDRLRGEYMQLNVELYGQPDETTYRSLLQEKLAAIGQKNLGGEAAQLREELFALVEVQDPGEKVERFKPSHETVEWMHETVEALYGGMLSHVPEQTSFSEAEVKDVFDAIIREEFGEAADGWRVAIEPAKSINVKSAEKRIVIPEDRGSLSREQLQRLVVHEIGVHMLRSVIGGETDLEPLKNGLNEYYDAEEGLGKVMEQALEGKFAEAGIDHYVTAGLSYYDHKDFRDTFEAKWRLAVLSSLEDGSDEISEKAVTKAKNSAYGGTMRVLRGTDELPWFKDLAYYNGSVEMWRYLESIRGDDTKFMFVLLGKANPSNSDHQRIQYETATR